MKFVPKPTKEKRKKRGRWKDPNKEGKAMIGKDVKNCEKSERLFHSSNQINITMRKRLQKWTEEMEEQHHKKARGVENRNGA